MSTVERTYDLFSPADVDFFGTPGAPEFIGRVRGAVCRLTGEEISENDMERSRQRYTGCVRMERSPLGGFVLRDDFIFRRYKIHGFVRGFMRTCVASSA